MGSRVARKGRTEELQNPVRRDMDTRCYRAVASLCSRFAEICCFILFEAGNILLRDIVECLEGCKWVFF